MPLFDFLKLKRKKEERVAAKREQVSAPPEKKVMKEGRIRAISERILNDVVRPHVTERSRQNSKLGVYMFRVSAGATKHTIKQAIETLYRVGVARVRVMRVPSKPRRRGLTRGTKKGYKKAAVLLRAGEHIELFS